MRYTIYEENMEKLEKKMTRIQNKCRKYGCDFRFEEVGEEYRTITNGIGNKRIGRFVIVEAEGVAVINGWKFIASIQHTENGNIIRAACDGVEIPERYYTGKPVCEHCKTNRLRKDTYLVQNVETGEFKQVGKTCLKDFTGGMSAEAVAEYTAAFDELIAGEATNGEGYVKSYVSTKDFLRFAAETIRHFGYVKNEPGVRSTKIRTEQYYYIENEIGKAFDVHNGRIEMQEAGFDANSEEAKKMTEDALNWIKEADESNTYMHNLKTACSLEYSEERNFGILVSLFPTYRREAEKQAADASEYVGEIGDKVEVKVADCVCVSSWATMYGETKIYRFTDENGNVFTWKTTGYVPEDVQSIKGTVKDHKEYRGEKQTELTRCRCVKAKKQKAHEAPTYDVDRAFADALAFFEG